MLKYICAFLFLICSDEPEEAIATHKNYKNAIGVYKNFNDRLFDQKYWDEIEITDKKTNETKKFASLTPLEKSTFIIVLSQQLSQESAKLQQAWQNELNKKFTSKDKDAVKKDDVIGYSKELFVIRKEFVGKYNDFVNKMLVDFKEQITEDEIKIMRGRMKELQNKFEKKGE